MAIQLKRAYERAAPEDGYRVLIDRIWPRGVSKEEAQLDAWLKQIAPSTPLRVWFHEDRSRWEGFRSRYLEELKEHQSELSELAARCAQGPVTLVYSARDPDQNNAVVLAEFLESILEASD